jgi:hypothetical protein
MVFKDASAGKGFPTFRKNVLPFFSRVKQISAKVRQVTKTMQNTPQAISKDKGHIHACERET